MSDEKKEARTEKNQYGLTAGDYKSSSANHYAHTISSYAASLTEAANNSDAMRHKDEPKKAQACEALMVSALRAIKLEVDEALAYFESSAS